MVGHSPHPDHILIQSALMDDTSVTINYEVFSEIKMPFGHTELLEAFGKLMHYFEPVTIRMVVFVWGSFVELRSCIKKCEALCHKHEYAQVSAMLQQAVLEQPSNQDFYSRMRTEASRCFAGQPRSATTRCCPLVVGILMEGKIALQLMAVQVAFKAPRSSHISREFSEEILLVRGVLSKVANAITETGANGNMVEAIRVARATCQMCEKPGKHWCSKCRSATYCSQACQKAHWRDHRRACSVEGRLVVVADNVIRTT